MDQTVFNTPNAINPGHENTVSAETALVYAGFWRRYAAALIDGLLTGIVGLVITFFAGTDMILQISLSAIINIIYFSIFDSSEMMGTPGKNIMGLVIISENSKARISFKTALIRHLVRWISGVLLGIGFLMQLFTSKRQTLHDMASETLVIKRIPPDINYFKAFKNNFSQVIG
jgi:uncharacterized RDD family membrane protein YckC